MNTIAFHGTLINASFPIAYFAQETLDSWVQLYGEDALDANQTVKTLFCRQDTEDPNSRRAASFTNESPMLLINNRMLLCGIDPTIKLIEAISNGEVADVQIITNEEINSYIEANKIESEIENG